jgi:hypothetical protein
VVKCLVTRWQQKSALEIQQKAVQWDSGDQISERVMQQAGTKNYGTNKQNQQACAIHYPEACMYMTS